MKKTVFILLFILIQFIMAQTPGNCLVFDGTNDCLTLPTSTDFNYSGSSVMSFEAWIYLASTSIYVPFFGKFSSGGGTAQYDLFINHLNQICFAVDNNASGWQYVCNSPSAFPTYEWVHVAIVKTGSDATIYLNGQNIANDLLSGSTISAGVSTGVCYIACSPNGFNKFPGMMDEIRIWNDARTGDEIRENMYRELPNPTGEANLVAYYKLNSSSGTTATDESSTGNDALLTNMAGTEWNVSGAFEGSNYCLYFDGSDEYVSLTNSSDLKPASALTLEFWLNPDSWNPVSDEQVISNLNAGGYALTLKGDSIRFAAHDGIDYKRVTYPSDSISAGWHHLACLFDGSNLSLYLDGRLVSSKATTGSSISYDVDNCTFIGQEVDGDCGVTSGTPYTGKIDELRIWNDVRTEKEIRENMCKTLRGDETNLAAYYRFDEGYGTILWNYVSANDALLNNMDNTNWVSSDAFNTWIGTSISDFASNGNWSGNAPGASSNIVVTPNFTTPLPSSSIDFNNFVLPSGSTLEMSNSAGHLNINGNYYQLGNLNFTDGTLSIKNRAFGSSGLRLISTSSADFTSKPLFD